MECESGAVALQGWPNATAALSARALRFEAGIVEKQTWTGRTPVQQLEPG